MTVPMGGGSPTTLFPTGANGIAVDTASVYWIDGTGAVTKLTPK
jgi:hypothetical protein